MTTGPESIASAWGIAPTTVVRPDRGWNNIVWLIDDAYVLRIYQNLDADRVAAEHRLLEALSGAGLPFAVPVPIATPDGKTFVTTPDGPAALYTFLPGRPGRVGDLTDIELAGAALGDLMTVLGGLPFELAPIDWRGPLSGVHTAVPDVAALAAELRSVAPDAKGLDVFTAHVERPDDAPTTLPAQICHLDYGLSNVLIDEGRVVGVLDFEVVGFDLRVNDFVAGLVQSTEHPDEEDAFVRGFRSRLDLTSEEWEAVPDLRVRRLVATVIWRAGRWREGKSTLDDVLERLAALAPS